MEKKIIPVLIGADLNCYNVARAFHEAYGVCSHAFGRYETSATLGSRIVTFHCVQHLDDDAVFIAQMRDFAASHGGENTALLLLGCTDDYANLIARNRTALEPAYIVPYNNIEKMNEFLSKERFYQCCDQHNILYPKTAVLHPEDTISPDRFTEAALGFSYPIIIKPSNSVVYWKNPFDGMHKVYTADTPAYAEEVVRTIFASGYDDAIILQDMIPGNDSGMYVLTAYCGSDKKVKMMCLGHVLLEEHTPKGRGNHAAILTEYQPELCKKFQSFLEDIGYVGFANFDIKYDPRDNSYRAFEVNLRQGRSNYYVTASGENIAQYLVADYVTHDLPDTTKLADRTIFWSSIPRSIVYRYAHCDTYTAQAKALCREGNGYSSLWYKKDTHGNFRRFFYVAAAQYRYYKKYRKYCRDYQ